MLEINSAPDRRDLNDVHARAAAARPACGSSSTPTRTASQHARASCAGAIATARRAWLTAADVANTLPWAEFAPLRKRAQAGVSR